MSVYIVEYYVEIAGDYSWARFDSMDDAVDHLMFNELNIGRNDAFDEPYVFEEQGGLFVDTKTRVTCDWRYSVKLFDITGFEPRTMIELRAHLKAGYSVTLFAGDRAPMVYRIRTLPLALYEYLQTRSVESCIMFLTQADHYSHGDKTVFCASMPSDAAAVLNKIYPFIDIRKTVPEVPWTTSFLCEEELTGDLMDSVPSDYAYYTLWSEQD